MPLSACSSYNDSDVIDNDEEIDDALAGDSNNKDYNNINEYPNLATVPERPVLSDIIGDYEKLKSGLIADIEHAKYSDQILRSQNIPDSNMTLIVAKKLPMSDIPNEAPMPMDINKKPIDQNNTAVETVAQAIAPAKSAKSINTKDNDLAFNDIPTFDTSSNNISTGSIVSKKIPKYNITSKNISTDSISPNDPPSSDGVSFDSNNITSNIPDNMIPKIIATIYFADDTSNITELDKSVVAQVADIFKENGKIIIITGHSSSIMRVNDNQQQSNMINFKMSLNRAEAVAEAFQALDIARAKIHIEARGSKQPRYVENNAAGIAGNRRAEIYIGY